MHRPYWGKRMSSRAIAWALALPDVDTEEKFVLAAIGAWTDDDGHFLSLLAPLAKRCSLSEQDLRKTLLRLEAKGLVDLGHDRPAEEMRITLNLPADARSQSAQTGSDLGNFA